MDPEIESSYTDSPRARAKTPSRKRRRRVASWQLARAKKAAKMASSFLQAIDKVVYRGPQRGSNFLKATEKLSIVVYLWG